MEVTAFCGLNDLETMFSTYNVPDVQMVSYSSVFAKIYTEQKTGPIFDDFSVYLRLLVKIDDNGIVGKDISTGELG